MTEVADPSTAAVAAARARPARGPQELDLPPRRRARRAARRPREPDWLAEDRRAALAAYEALPVEPNQLYTPYVDLRAADLADVARPTPPTGVRRRRRPRAPADGLAALASFEEDGVASIAIADAAAPGRRHASRRSPASSRRDPEAARRLLADDVPRPPTTGSPSSAAPPGARASSSACRPASGSTQPIVVRWAVGAPGRALHARTIVELGEGAEASLVEELVAVRRGSCAGGQALFTATTEIHLGPRRGSRWPASRSSGRTRSCSSSGRAHIGEGADLRWALAQLGGRLVRSRVDNVLAGDRSTVEQVEIVFGSDDQLHDLTSYTRHVGRDTTGQLLSKGVLMDKARSYLKGLITIEKSAIGTDSYLGEFGMNLSKSARAVAIPSLEIDQPDCRRAAHACSVGPIDETQLFYLETRGIPPDEARKFIVLGLPRAGRRARPARGGAGPPARGAGGQVGRRPGRRTSAAPPPDAATETGRVSRRIDLLGVDELAEGEMRMVWVDETDPVLVVHVNGEFHALQGTCSHEYFELDRGFLTAGTLTCALHLSRFDLTDGEPLDPPAELPLAVYAVEIVDGRVTIEVGDGPLEVNEE